MIQEKDTNTMSADSKKELRDQYDGLRRHSRESNELVKECLRTAMTRLARQMDYKEISVTKLCAEAGVSRMAFYRNYQVVNDVIYEIANKLNTDVLSEVGSPFRKTTGRDWYIRTFQLLGDRSEEMNLMFQENFQAQWMKIVISLAVHDDNFSPEKKYQRIMWSGGFENAVACWLNKGMQESPEEMADYCMKYLPHITVNYGDGGLPLS